MKQFVLIFLFAATVISTAQTPSKPAATAKPTTSAKPATTSTTGVQLPPGVPRQRGAVKNAFTLRYQEIKIGTGAEAEPNKIYKVMYTGWLASNGTKFDSSYDHRLPVIGKDGKPELGDDGKPKLGDPQPITIPQGFGRVIPGFDQGFYGMKIGGKRRLFIPWQLAYGARGRPGPDPAHPGIPPKADLIFDIELVDVTDMQMPPNHPGPGGMPIRPGMAPPHPVTPGAASGPGTPPTPAGTATPGTPGAPATPAPSASSAASPSSGTPPTPASPTTPQPSDKPQSK